MNRFGARERAPRRTQTDRRTIRWKQYFHYSLRSLVEDKKDRGTDKLNKTLTKSNKCLCLQGHRECCWANVGPAKCVLDYGDWIESALATLVFFGVSPVPELLQFNLHSKSNRRNLNNCNRHRLQDCRHTRWFPSHIGVQQGHSSTDTAIPLSWRLCSCMQRHWKASLIAVHSRRNLNNDGSVSLAPARLVLCRWIQLIIKWCGKREMSPADCVRIRLPMRTVIGYRELHGFCAHPTVRY